MNINGNIVSGQVSGDTMRQLSERLDKIMQERVSRSVNHTDTSLSYSKQLEQAMPASKIAKLSSGEFVGVVSDDPGNKITLKAFCNEIINDHKTINKEERDYKEMPVVRKLDNDTVRRNYTQIKNEVKEIVDSELARIKDDPELKHLIVHQRRD